MKQLAIIGAGGHGKVIADIAELNGYDEIVFLDDKKTCEFCGYPVIGSSTFPLSLDEHVVVAIGDSNTREKIQSRFSKERIVTLIHPNAVVAKDVTIGKGTVVMAGVVINSGTVIGEGCIINTSSSIDHDCIIGDFVHIAVGSHICGTVNVGRETWIGAGAIISNNVNICQRVIVGAGAVVIKDIKMAGTYVGIPAQILDRKH